MWTAYRYSAGELSEADSTEFETLLADDQTAREALAMAVGLAETIRAAEQMPAARPATSLSPTSMPASVSRAAWQRTAGWVAVAAAASVALLFAWQGLQHEGNPAQPARPVAEANPADDESRLLLAMINRPQAQEAIEEALEEAPSALVPSVALDDGDDLSELEPSATLDEANTAPDWLLAAVAESKQ